MNKVNTLCITEKCRFLIGNKSCWNKTICINNKELDKEDQKKDDNRFDNLERN